MERTTLVAVIAVVAIGAVGAAGCAEGAAPPDLTAPSLTQPLQLTAARPTAESEVSFDISTWGGGQKAHLAMLPSDLRLVLRTGRHGEITGLELPLADQDISAEALPPSGLMLRELQLGLDDTVELETEASTDDYLELHAEAPLRLAWSVVLADGSVYGLGPAVTTPLSFDVQVEREAGQLTARVYARCSGDCWTLDGLARISDGQIHLVAPAEIQPLD
jgi:hypothetical protein